MVSMYKLLIINSTYMLCDNNDVAVNEPNKSTDSLTETLKKYREGKIIVNLPNLYDNRMVMCHMEQCYASSLVT